MSTPPKTPVNRNKAVIAYLDGRRLKGYIYNFSAVNDSFRLFSQADPLQDRGTQVDLKDLKAVFFVKDFSGSPEYKETAVAGPPKSGRKLEVIFSDGETLVGTTDAYNPQKFGFFIFPTDPQSNNLRIFVVNKNVSRTKFL